MLWELYHGTTVWVKEKHPKGPGLTVRASPLPLPLPPPTIALITSLRLRTG